MRVSNSELNLIQELAKNESLRRRDSSEYRKMLESYNIH
jgi:hypothetical protein